MTEFILNNQECENFELLVNSKTTEGYPATVTHAPAGSANDILQIDLADSTLQSTLVQIKDGTIDARILEDFGRRLFDMLFTAKIANILYRSLSQVRARNRGLRIRLHLKPPELAALPWEYLYSANEDCFLGISSKTPLVRYVPMGHSARPATVTPPLRILVVISSPIDFDQLEVMREKEIVQQALDEWVGQGLVQLEFVEHATIDEINQAMRSFRPHIFHLIGHGRFVDDEASVILEDSNKKPHPMDECQFREFFSGIDDTRVVVLNACQSATMSSVRPLSGLAHRVLQRRLAAVVAMQYNMSDEAARIFSREFYRSLASGYSVDAAVTEARRGIYLEKRDLGSRSWGIPVLFLRASDGRLFDVEGSVKLPPQPEELPEVADFVGREAELSYYSDQLEKSNLAVVTGAPGVGKTALAKMLAGQHLDPNKIFFHNFYEKEGMEKLIRKLAGFLFWQRQKDVWRMIQRALKDGRQPPSNEWLVQSLIEDLGGQGCLVFLDNCRNVADDPLFRQLVEGMGSQIASGELQVLITSRSRLPFGPDHEFEPLSGLEAGDAHDLLVGYGLTLPPALESELYEYTQGNAQFLVLAAGILQDSVAQEKEEMIGGFKRDEDVQRYLFDQIDRHLTKDERLVMNSVAVLKGYPGTRDAIEAVADTEGLQRALRILENRYLLFTSPGEGDEGYSQHDLVREFYYDEILGKKSRSEMHLRAGEYYENEEPQFRRAALHFELIGQDKRAGDLYLRGYDNQNAIRLYERALDAASELKDQIRLCNQLGQTHYRIGEYEQAIQRHEQALEKIEWQQPVDTRAQAETLFFLGRSYNTWGKAKESLPFLDKGIDLLEGSKNSILAELLIVRCAAAGILGNFDDADRDGCEARKIAQVLGQKELEARAWNNLGANEGRRRQFQKALDYHKKSLDLRKKLELEYDMVQSLANIGTAHDSLGNPDLAIANYEKALEIGERTGNLHGVANIHGNLGIAYMARDDLAKAEREYSRALEIWLKLRNREAEAFVRHDLGDLRIEQERFEEANEQLTRSAQLYIERDVLKHLFDNYMSLTEAYMGLNRYKDAEDAAQKAINRAREEKHDSKGEKEREHWKAKEKTARDLWAKIRQKRGE